MAARRGAFVAGATGYVGQAVVAALAERGLAVVAHVRPDSRRLAAWTARFEALGATVDTTPWDATAMAETLARHQPAWVFALLGTTRARAKQEGRSAAAAYRAVDYGLTRLLLDAAAPVEGVRFVYLSSMGASLTTRNAYLRARGDAEAAIRASGVRYTIARPAFISGPDREERRPSERVASRLFDGALAVAGLVGARRLRRRYRTMDAAELAGALIAAAERPAHDHELLRADDLRGRLAAGS